MFSFHDTDTAGWKELGDSIERSGWKIHDFVSVTSEFKFNSHLSDYKDPLDKDILIICEKHLPGSPPLRPKTDEYRQIWQLWESLYPEAISSET